MFASLQNKQKLPGLHFLLQVLTNAESAHTEQSFAKPVKNIYCTVQRKENYKFPSAPFSSISSWQPSKVLDITFQVGIF